MPAEQSPKCDTMPGRYRFSEQVGFLLRRAYQRHLAIFQANTFDAHLTAVQFSTLCALCDRGPQSQGELVRATSVDQATIRGIIARLKERGLIVQSRDSADARKLVIAITPDGADLVRRTIPQAASVTELTLAPLNPAERLALLHTLRLLGEDADSPDPDGQ